MWSFFRRRPKAVLEFDKSELKKLEECVPYSLGGILIKKIRDFTSAGFGTVLASVTIPIPFWREEYLMLYVHRKGDRVRIGSAPELFSSVVEISLNGQE